MKKFMFLLFLVVSTAGSSLFAMLTPNEQVHGAINKRMLENPKQYKTEKSSLQRFHSFLTAHAVADYFIANGSGGIANEDLDAIYAEASHADIKCPHACLVSHIEQLQKNVLPSLKLVTKCGVKKSPVKKALFPQFLHSGFIQIIESSNQAGPSQKVASGICVSLPDNIELEPGAMYQMESAEQSAEECGCYAKYNALVISDLLKNRKAISSKSIQDWGVVPLVTDAGIANWVDDTTVFSDLAVVLPGQNVYMLKVEQINHGEAVQVVPAGCSLDEHCLGMDDFWKNVRNKDAENVGYFMVNLENSHWVTVVALKQAGKMGPSFLYLDSKNVPIKEHLLAQHLEPYFEKQAKA